MTPSPYLTGDMPSSGTAVNAIVGRVRREAVVADSVLSRSIAVAPRPGCETAWGFGSAPAPIPPFGPGREAPLPLSRTTFSGRRAKISLT